MRLKSIFKRIRSFITKSKYFVIKLLVPTSFAWHEQSTVRATDSLVGIKDKGFTLIETMVAITVLMTAIVGPMEIASKSLLSAYYARDQITAYYLAQEGVEYLRNERDMHYLPPSTLTDWPSDFSNCIYNASTNNFGCKVDAHNSTNVITRNTTAGTNFGSPNDASTTLNYDSDTGLYSYSTGGKNEPSKYTRVVIVSPDPTTNPNPESILVSSTVYWTGSYLPGSTKSFTIKETLYKWPVY